MTNEISTDFRAFRAELRDMYLHALRQAKIAHDLAEETEDSEDYAQYDEERGHANGIGAALRAALMFPGGMTERDAINVVDEYHAMIRDEPIEETRAHVD